MDSLPETLRDDLERALALQNTLLDRATGKGDDEFAYKQLRHYFINLTSISDLLPQFIRHADHLASFGNI